MKDARTIRPFPAVLAALLVLCVPAVRAAGGAQPAVAVVAGTEITAEDFRAHYVDYLIRAGLRDEPRLRVAVLEQLVAARLMAQGARAAGVEQEAAYRVERERAYEKLLLDRYAAEAIYDTVQVRARDVADLFVRVNTTLRARHLYARTREQADRLYARLQAGETFEALAREVFADTVLAANGGSVGTFGFDEMDPAFEDAAFALAVGEVSTPVRTAQGYSIIQLEDRFTHPLLTEAEFERRRAKLEQFVLQRNRTAARTAFTRDLAAALDLDFDEDALGRLLDQVTGRALVEGGEADGAWLARPLVSFAPDGRRRTWTVADFRDAARFTDAEQRAQVATREDLVAFVQGVVVRHVLLERARAAGLDGDAVFAQALEETMDEWIVRQVRDRLVAETVVPEDSVRAFFAAHADAFVVPAQVRVWEIMTETKAEADRLKALLPAQAFDELARRHSVRPGADATGGDLGWLDRETLRTFGDAVWAAGEGDVVGPLEVAGRYVLFRVGARRPAAPMAYEAARAGIYDQLHGAGVEAALRAHVRALRARYDVTIDEARLAALPLVGPGAP